MSIKQCQETSSSTIPCVERWNHIGSPGLTELLGPVSHFGRHRLKEEGGERERMEKGKKTRPWGGILPGKRFTLGKEGC